jgi:poly(A) polymerase
MPDEVPQIRPGTACDREDALAVLRRLREAGHVAYFAGGCVRDLLLGLTPKDYDIATAAPPQRVQELFPRTQAVGVAFGVILVKYRRSTIEVATFRSDGVYRDGRRPADVTFTTTAEEDAKRRDFTINGLFLDPLDGNRVIDYVGGQADVLDRVLRAIGNPSDRFEEDHLRLLRAVRFAARFGLGVEPATAWAIARHADALRRISPERIADELRRMLAPPTRQAAWTMLWEYGLIHVIMRMLPRAGGRNAPLPTLNPGRSILLAMAPGASVSFGTALAAGTLCYEWHAAGFPVDVRLLLEKPAVQEAARAVRATLKISNEELVEMTGVLRGPAPLLAEAEPTVARMKRYLAEPTSAGSRHLLAALASVGLHAERINWLTPRLADLAATDYAPAPFVTGDDLTAAGLTPGPVFKRVLDEVYDAQLEGRVAGKAEALNLALRLAQRPSPGGA